MGTQHTCGLGGFWQRREAVALLRLGVYPDQARVGCRAKHLPQPPWRRQAQQTWTAGAFVVGGQAHTGLDGSFVVLEFAKAQTIVHLEHKRSGLFLDEPGIVAPFVSAVDTLRQIALDPHRSAEFVASLVAEYDRE